MNLSDDIKNAYYDGYDDGYNAGFEAGQRDAMLKQMPPEQQHKRIFQEIVVEYLPYNIYPEYVGKPYFLIKYTENGQEFIGYGTFKPEVLMEYLKKYFILPTQPERKIGRWLDGYQYGYKCSECGAYLEIDCGDIEMNYCPNCGSYNGGKQE